MLKKNIKYKQVVRLQLFGDDNIYNTTRYQYSTMGTSTTAIINSTRMSFDFRGNRGMLYYQKMLGWL